MTSWRDVLPVHPAADLFPMMLPDELRALGEDIKKNGLAEPIKLVRGSGGVNDNLIIDGRNRLAAMEAVGLPVLTDDGRLNWNVVRTADVRGIEPIDYVLSINVHRRHLTAEQRRDLIAKVLKAKPEASNRQIAKQVKADHKTVGEVRKAKEATGEIPQLPKTVGADGRARKASPQRAGKPTAQKHEPEKPTAQKVDSPPLSDVPAAATLFEPEIESASSDEGLDASQLKSQNKRLRAKIKSLRKHISKLGEDVRQEREYREATGRKLTLTRGEFSGAKVEEIANALCALPNAIQIIERTIWGLADDDQEALLRSLGARS